MRLFGTVIGGDSTSERRYTPWVTSLAITACAAIFLGLIRANDYKSWDTLSKFGYLSSNAIWRGSYWGLVTTTFVHFELWHIAFNMYWLWVLGSRMEFTVGRLRYLAFIVVAAFVSSAFQLAASNATGIGASGFVYAMFGFAWASRNRYPVFAEVLDRRTIEVFLVWLFGCVVVTYLGVLQIGNAAHFSGLIFGAVTAAAFSPGGRKALLCKVGLVGLVTLAIVPLAWCPWSPTWLGIKAYDAHAAHKLDEAVGYYSRIIEIDPKNAWAYHGRGSILWYQDSDGPGVDDMRKAHELDPTYELP